MSFKNLKTSIIAIPIQKLNVKIIYLKYQEKIGHKKINLVDAQIIFYGIDTFFEGMQENGLISLEDIPPTKHLIIF